MGDRPLLSGGDVVTLEDTRELFVAYLEYEQQKHIYMSSMKIEEKGCSRRGGSW